MAQPYLPPSSQPASRPKPISSQAPWRPFESKAFAAAIVLMVGIPILIGIILALRQRHKYLKMHMKDLENQDSRQQSASLQQESPLQTPHAPPQQDSPLQIPHEGAPQVVPLEPPRDNYYEDHHWAKVARRMRKKWDRPSSHLKNTKLGRLIYCRYLRQHPGEVLGDTEDIAQASGRLQDNPLNSLPGAARQTNSGVDSTAAPGIGLPQNTFPPAGPSAQSAQPSFMPQMQGGAIGGGPFVRSPPTRAHAGPPMPAVYDSGLSHPQRSLRRSVAIPSGYQESNGLNDNIPMAMPLFTSRPGVRPSDRSRRRSPAPNISSMHDGSMSTRRPSGQTMRKRSDMVTSLLGGLRDGHRAPQNTEMPQRPKSPPTDGQDESTPTVRPRRMFESPLEHMRRSHAMSHVIQETQNYLGNYPDIAALVGTLPDVTSHTRRSPSRHRKKSRTTFPL